MEPSEFEAKVQEAAESNSYALRDEDGCIFWADTVDEDGVYYSSDEGETYRATWEQALRWFELVPEEEL